MSALSCGSPTLPMSRGYQPKLPTGGTGGCVGGCNGFMDTAHKNDAQCCGNGSELTEHIVIVDGPECPPGYISPLVNMAKTNPLFSGLFGCMADCDIADFICCYEQYRLPSCANGDMAVLMAAAHFLTLQTSGNFMSQETMRNQAKNGKPLRSLDISGNAAYAGDGHWFLTMFGLQYQTQFKAPARAVSGMAWGV